MTYPKEFKEAIAALPSKEKDKLILRLLKKDLVLANRLMFELVSETTVDERRSQLEQSVRTQVGWMAERFYSPGYLHMDMRYLSGEINEHVSITKDRFGEAYLNLVMLTEVLDKVGPLTMDFAMAKTRKFALYIVARAFKIMVMISKLHEDYWMEFEDLTTKLGHLIGKYPYLMDMAIYHGLDVNWLINFDFPEDIVQIHKDLRNRGYLK